MSVLFYLLFSGSFVLAQDDSSAFTSANLYDLKPDTQIDFAPKIQIAGAARDILDLRTSATTSRFEAVNLEAATVQNSYPTFVFDNNTSAPLKDERFYVVGNIVQDSAQMQKLGDWSFERLLWKLSMPVLLAAKILPFYVMGGMSPALIVPLLFFVPKAPTETLGKTYLRMKGHAGYRVLNMIKNIKRQVPNAKKIYWLTNYTMSRSGYVMDKVDAKSLFLIQAEGEVDESKKIALSTKTENGKLRHYESGIQEIENLSSIHLEFRLKGVEETQMSTPWRVSAKDLLQGLRIPEKIRSEWAYFTKAYKNEISVDLAVLTSDTRKELGTYIPSYSVNAFLGETFFRRSLVAVKNWIQMKSSQKESKKIKINSKEFKNHSAQPAGFCSHYFSVPS